MSLILNTDPAIAPVSGPDTGLYQALYERALIDLWPHLSFDHPPERILDLGCGRGTVAKALSGTFERARITALGAQSSAPGVQFIDVPPADWLPQAHEAGPFDLLISHNGWPLDWTLESGLERLIEVVAPGGQVLLHLDLTLYSAFAPGFGVYAKLDEAYRRLGHLTAGDRLEIWRTDLASEAMDVRRLTGLLAAMVETHPDISLPVEALGRLKAELTEDGRLISRHLFLKLRL